MRKFKSNTGSPVRLFVPFRPEPIEVPYYAPHLETDDERVIDALEGSPEVVEVESRAAETKTQKTQSAASDAALTGDGSDTKEGTDGGS